jgi:hypothetical protein
LKGRWEVVDLIPRNDRRFVTLSRVTGEGRMEYCSVLLHKHQTSNVFLNNEGMRERYGMNVEMLG